MIMKIKTWVVDSGKIIYKPTQKTFDEVSKNAKGRFIEAVVWIVITGIIVTSLGYQFSISLIERLLLSAIALPIGILVQVFWIHTIYQKVFRRKKYKYDELLYSIAMILVTPSLLSSVLIYIPKIGPIIMQMTGIYQLVLGLLAIRAITKLNLWQSFITLVMSLLMAVISIALVPFCLTSLYCSTANLM
jgi:hypothetical protein